MTTTFSEGITMEGYCGSSFWNSSLSWNTNKPDFSPCFKETVLVWIPCMFLWIFSLYEVYCIRQSGYRNIPWNNLNVSKIYLTFGLITMSVFDLTTALHYEEREEFVYHVEIHNPLIQFFTWVLSGVLLVYNRKYGICSSGVLFLFWLLSVVCGIPQMVVLNLNSRNLKMFNKYVLYLVSYMFQVCMLVLNCYPDRPPLHSIYREMPNPSPEPESSFISRLFFYWFDPVIFKAYKRTLQMDDLYDVGYRDYPDLLYAKFEGHWKKALEKEDLELYRDGRFDVDEIDIEPVSVMPALYKTFMYPLLFASFLRLLQDLVSFTTPLMLELLLVNLQNKERRWQATLYVFTMLFGAVLQTLLLSQYYYRVYLIGIRARAITVSAIYKKAFRISNMVKKRLSTAGIVKLMQVDALVLDRYFHHAIMYWSLPLRSAIAIYLIWRLIGLAVLPGLLVMVLFVALQCAILQKLRYLQRIQTDLKNRRIAIVKEVINNIAVVKLYDMELYFKERIVSIRQDEVLTLKKHSTAQSILTLMQNVVPFLVTLASFATFVHLVNEAQFTPHRAFVCWTLFFNMQLSLNKAPLIWMEIVETHAAIKRINKFLNSAEMNPSNVTHDTTYGGNDPVVIENGNFSWGGDLVLKDIDFKCTRGEVVGIVGAQGSGKTSLLYALLGEINKISGNVNTIGSMAYVGPTKLTPPNTSVRNAIIFGKAFDEKRYQEVVRACRLEDCFSQLPAGDATDVAGVEFPEEDVLKINLARAVYSNADVYLIDADSTAESFYEMLGPRSSGSDLLKASTRLIATNELKHLVMADTVVVLANGTISQKGTLEHLIEGNFAQRIIKYLETTKHNDQEMQDFVAYLIKVSKKHKKQFEKIGETLKAPEEKEVGVTVKVLSGWDKIEKGKIKPSAIKFYLHIVGFVVTGLIIFAYMLDVGLGISAMGSLFFWTRNPDLTVDQHNTYIMVYVLLAAVHVLFLSVVVVVLCRCCVNASRMLYSLLLERVLRAPATSTIPSDQMLNQFVTDDSTVDIPVTVSAWLYNLVIIISTFVIITYNAPILLIFVLPIACASICIEAVYTTTTRELNRLRTVNRPQTDAYISETIDSAFLYRVYDQTENCTAQFDYQADLLSYSLLYSQRWLAVRLAIVGTTITFLTAFFGILKNATAAFIGLALSYTLHVTTYLDGFIETSATLKNDVLSVEHIKQYIDSMDDENLTISLIQIPEFWPKSGLISFNHYSAKYNSDKQLALNDVNFTVNGKEKVGIVGREGSGKTALIMAICRMLNEADGEILIDDVDIAQADLHTLRSRLTIVPQRAVLFSGTIRSNIDPYETHTDDEVWWALDQVYLKDYVQGLPLGMYTEIEEADDGFLTLGQKQLLCFSRAFLKQSKVVLVDAATTGLDLETEKLILKRVNEVFQDSTVLTVAYRLNSVLDSDKVIVLDGGNVAEYDSPNSLIRNKQSLFYKLCKDDGLVHD